VEGEFSMAKRMNFYLTEIQVKRLPVMSKKTGLTASEVLRRAIDEYWERFEKKGRGKT
jgi:predicted DNA-binding protein